MPHDPEPFQLDFAIPEIGAEPGDWIAVDDGADPPEVVLVRRITRERVGLIRHHLSRLSQFLSCAPADPSPAPSGRALVRLK